MSTPELASFKPEPKSIWPWGVIFVAVAFMIGFALGGLGGSEQPVEATAAEPVPTATATVNKTTAVEVTPQVCLDALDIADEGFTVASEAMFAAQGTVEALLESDLAGMEQSNAELSAAAAKLGPLADRYNEAKGSCRTGAK